jgi:hypothetical protein
MPWVEFKPTIQVFELAKSVHALDRAATVIGAMRTSYPETQIYRVILNYCP